MISIWLRIFSYFPLLVLKGIYDYWMLFLHFFQGASQQMEGESLGLGLVNFSGSCPKFVGGPRLLKLDPSFLQLEWKGSQQDAQLAVDCVSLFLVSGGGR